MDITRKKIKIIGLLDSLIDQLEESVDIFFEERPALWQEGNKPLIITESERRDQNEKNIKATREELGKTIQEEVRENEQDTV